MFLHGNFVISCSDADVNTKFKEASLQKVDVGDTEVEEGLLRMMGEGGRLENGWSGF